MAIYLTSFVLHFFSVQGEKGEMGSMGLPGPAGPKGDSSSPSSSIMETNTNQVSDLVVANRISLIFHWLTD